MRQQTDLSAYNNSSYDTGRNIIVRLLWLTTNVFFFKNPLSIFNTLKITILRIFGAKIGRNVVIKPSVNIKYPWKLSVGDNTWIGEDVWIDNLDEVKIGSNVCISQGALLLCGNHNYKKSTFDLITSPITIEDGVWLGAKTIVTGGVICGSHSVLSVGSVASKNLDAWAIYKGNPATKTAASRNFT